MKNATITLYRRELYTDIDAKTFKRTDASMVKEAERTQNAVASDTNEDLDELLIMRYCDLWDARMRRRLKFCIKDESEDLTYTDIPNEQSAYVYNLSLDDSITRSDIQSLGTLMHNFIVRGALHDWYMHCGFQPTDGEDVLDELLEDIVGTMRGKSYGRRPMQPFGPAYNLDLELDKRM